MQPWYELTRLLLKHYKSYPSLTCEWQCILKNLFEKLAVKLLLFYIYLMVTPHDFLKVIKWKLFLNHIKPTWSAFRRTWHVLYLLSFLNICISFLYCGHSKSKHRTAAIGNIIIAVQTEEGKSNRVMGCILSFMAKTFPIDIWREDLRVRNGTFTLRQQIEMPVLATLTRTVTLPSDNVCLFIICMLIVFKRAHTHCPVALYISMRCTQLDSHSRII